MLKILFCNIAWMKYYKGICENDQPYFNEDHKAGIAGEIHCFNPIFLLEEDNNTSKAYCMGAVEADISENGRNEILLQNIEGYEGSQEAEYTDSVLIVWCAKEVQGETSIIGWYKDAVVYREYQELLHTTEDDTEDYRLYNICATADKCTLLPTSNRTKAYWNIPTDESLDYGFERGNVWYAKRNGSNIDENRLVNRIVDQINEYNEENWIDKYPGR